MFQKHHLSPIPQSITQTTIRGFTLPESYLILLNNDGAGYLQRNKLQTPEPTRYGLDFALLNGIFGFEKSTSFSSITDIALSPQKTQLPEYLVPFFQDDNVYFCFDYKDTRHSPSIRLVDMEMDQWISIAKNFSVLLDTLQKHTEPIDYEHRNWLTQHTIFQQLGTFQEENFLSLIEILEDTDLAETVKWLQDAIRQNSPLSKIACDHLAFLQEFRQMEMSQLQNR